MQLNWPHGGKSQRERWQRLRGVWLLATRAVIYHELALLGGGALLLAFTWGAVNHVGGYTYLVLWIMRLSAKLNLFFGVRNTYSHFLPPHMAYLGTYFRQRNSIGKFFTVSVAMAATLSRGAVVARVGASR